MIGGRTWQPQGRHHKSSTAYGNTGQAGAAAGGHDRHAGSTSHCSQVFKK